MTQIKNEHRRGGQAPRQPGRGRGWLWGVSIGLCALAPAWAQVSTTGVASNVGAASATLGGNVDAQAIATYNAFEYGSSPAYGLTAVAAPRVLSSSGTVSVSAQVSGLSCNTSYHFRLNKGSDASFTTSACEAPGAPVVEAVAAGANSAVLRVSPPASNGGAPITTYTATSGALQGSCSGPGACIIVVPGLSPGQPYSFTVTASNGVVGSPGLASAPTTSVTPAAGSLGGAGVKVLSMDLGVSPSQAVIEVVMAEGSLVASDFTLSNTSSPGVPATVNSASYANGKYTLVVSGLTVRDSYSLSASPAGFTPYQFNGLVYGAPATAADMNLVDELNIFPSYTRTLGPDGVLTIGNSMYAENARLYSGTVYDAIDSNNGNPDNGSSVRLIGAFGIAPTGAQCVRTLRTSGQIVQVTSDSLIDANPNYQETIASGQAANDNGYWKTLLFLPMYAQIASARDTLDSNARTLQKPADRFRIIEWYDSSDCSGAPAKVLRLNTQVVYSGRVVVGSSTPAPTVSTQPVGLTVEQNASATLSVVAGGSGGTLSYQWYSNSSNSFQGATPISLATGSSYSAPTSTLGTVYYYVVVTQTVGGASTSVLSDVAAVTTQLSAVCGAAAGQASAFQPVTGLCSSGNAGSVLRVGNSWGWTCSGSGGGGNQNCSAPTQDTATQTGQGYASVGGSGWVIDAQRSRGFVAVTADGRPQPKGYSLPQGLFDFTLTSGSGTASITIHYPTPVPAGAVYLKYGSSPEGYSCSGNCSQPHWYVLPASQAVFAPDRQSVTLTLTDNQVGDSNSTVGEITDPGGPALPEDAGLQSVPTLSPAALGGLAGLLGLGTVGLAWRRRRAAVGGPR